MSPARHRFLILLFLFGMPLIGGVLGSLAELIISGSVTPGSIWGNIITGILLGSYGAIASAILGLLLSWLFRDRKDKYYSLIGYAVPSIIMFIYIIFGIAMQAAEPKKLSTQIDREFSQLNLPGSFELVSTVKKTDKGDFVTGPSAVQARTYKVSMSMAEANETVLRSLGVKKEDLLNAQSLEDDKGFPVENLVTCSVGFQTLTSNIRAVILFSESSQGAQVELDEDNNVVNLQSYTRKSCDTKAAQSYVTIVTSADKQL